MQPLFRKRTLKMTDAVWCLTNLIRNRTSIARMFREKTLTPLFMEKIMMAVTAVNKCAICSYGHTKAALEEGVSPNEIAQILSFDLGDFPEEESVALAFAQHYAETRCKPSKDSCKRLLRYYGLEKASAISNACLFITMGNLGGNTLEKVQNRTGIQVVDFIKNKIGALPASAETVLQHG